MPEAPLTVVIVTYNSAEVLPALLDSLPGAMQNGEPYEILVIDNQSSDDSVAIAAAHPLSPKLAQMGRNAGYSAAINAALVITPPERAVLVLNPDIRLHADAVTAMMQRLRGQTGIVVPCILEENDTLYHSIRREPSLLTAWSEALLGGGLSSRLGLGEIVTAPQTYAAAHPITWASGAALLISPSAREAIGPWDESFFLYSEEIDFMRRARQAGFEILFEPCAVATHIGGDSNRDRDLFALLTANRIRYYRRYHGAAASLLFQIGVALGLMLRLGRGPIHRPALHAALTLSQGRFAALAAGRPKAS